MRPSIGVLTLALLARCQVIRAARKASSASRSERIHAPGRATEANAAGLAGARGLSDNGGSSRAARREGRSRASSARVGTIRLDRIAGAELQATGAASRQDQNARDSRHEVIRAGPIGRPNTMRLLCSRSYLRSVLRPGLAGSKAP